MLSDADLTIVKAKLTLASRVQLIEIQKHIDKVKKTVTTHTRKLLDKIGELDEGMETKKVIEAIGKPAYQRMIRNGTVYEYGGKVYRT